MEEARQIRDMITLVDSGDPLSPLQRKEILDAFERLECWAPFFRLIKASLAEDAASLEFYVRLAKVQNLHLEDVFEAAETCAQAVERLDLSYSQFLQEVIPFITEQDDWTAEATILQAACRQFAKAEDRVSAMERLCLIYEKKVFNEGRLHDSYNELLKLDESNLKALRYFKLVHTQNYEWDKVVVVLHKLIETSSHPQDLFRVAQELAGVYLYQLDNPGQAVAVIENHCEGSPLDTSTIAFDAYHRLKKWDGCLRVLRECLLGVESDSDRAVLMYKIGQLEEKSKSFDAAEKSYLRANELDPEFLEVYEALVYLSLLRKDWPKVRQWLLQLSEQVGGDENRSRLLDAEQRLGQGLDHAQNG